jgi:hypothetical protein
LQPLSDWSHFGRSTRPAMYDDDSERLNTVLSRQETAQYRASSQNARSLRTE